MLVATGQFRIEKQQHRSHADTDVAPRQAGISQYRLLSPVAQFLATRTLGCVSVQPEEKTSVRTRIVPGFWWYSSRQHLPCSTGCPVILQGPLQHEWTLWLTLYLYHGKFCTVRAVPTGHDFAS